MPKSRRAKIRKRPSGTLSNKRNVQLQKAHKICSQKCEHWDTFNEVCARFKDIYLGREAPSLKMGLVFFCVVVGVER